MKTYFLFGTLLFSLLNAGPSFAKDKQVRFGDVRNGEKLFKQITEKCRNTCGDIMKQDALSNGNRISVKSNKGLIRMIQGDIGSSDVIEKTPSLLEMIDIVTYLRAHNTDLSDLGIKANRAFHGTGTLDEFARERLEKEGGVLPPKGEEASFKIVAFYSIPNVTGALKVVPDNLSQRDVLEPNLVTGFAVFMPLEKFKGGGYEVAIGVDQDIRIKNIFIRAPDGSLPASLNRAARRFIGKGLRGKYSPLRSGGAGDVRLLQKPLTKAFLLGMEAVYMYEQSERERFAL
jgi:hypothetical protein